MYQGRLSFPVACVPSGKYRFAKAPDKQDGADHRNKISNSVSEPLRTDTENILKNNRFTQSF
jgi:hypothetical protein